MASNLPLTYRTVGVWGEGKGANLTPVEVDENFYTIDEAIKALIENPIAGVGIISIELNGARTGLVIHLSDGTTLGPFYLPTASFKPTGGFVADRQYNSNDLITEADGLYFVNRPFSSGAFDPNYADGAGLVLTKIATFPTTFRIGWFWPTKPGAGLDDVDDVMFATLISQSLYIPANANSSMARLRQGPTADVTYTVSRNGIAVGTLDFAAPSSESYDSSGTPGPVDGVFSGFDTGPVQFVAGDVLALDPPDAIDATARSLMVQLVCVIGILNVESSS